MINVVATASTNVSASPQTLSLTCSGSDRVLLVAVGFRSAATTVNDITYNGVAMTLVDRQVHTTATDLVSELWYLADPSIGTNDISVTFDPNVDPTRASIGALCATGVNQTSPVDGQNKAEGNSTSASVSVNTTAGNVLGVASVASRAVGAMSPAAGTIEFFDLTDGTSHQAGGVYRWSGSPGGTVALTETVASGEWAVVAATLKPVTPSFREPKLRPAIFAPGNAR